MADAYLVRLRTPPVHGTELIIDRAHTYDINVQEDYVDVWDHDVAAARALGYVVLPDAEQPHPSLMPYPAPHMDRILAQMAADPPTPPADAPKGKRASNA